MDRSDRNSYRAFTIVELLVAMSITLVLMFLVNRLFFETVRAVGRGAQLSDVLAASRTVSDQIHKDSVAMVGPSEGGFLVIINRRVEDVKFGIYQDGSIKTRAVRSDQLIFIRRAHDLEPLTPGTNNSFNNGARAAYARLWYGHVLRTSETGSSSAGAMLGTDANNLTATNWILGRQALLLAGTGGAAGTNNRVAGATYSDLVGTNPFWLGYSDVSDQTLSNITGSGLGPLNSNLNEAAYRRQAYQYAFPTPDSTGVGNAGELLRVNPVPDGTDFT